MSTSSTESVREIVTHGGQVQIVRGYEPLFIWRDDVQQWFTPEGEQQDAGLVALFVDGAL